MRAYLELIESQCERKPQARPTSPLGFEVVNGAGGDALPDPMKATDWPGCPISADLGNKATSYWSLDLSQELALVYFHLMFEREEDFLKKSVYNEKIGEILKGDGQCRVVGRIVQ